MEDTLREVMNAMNNFSVTVLILVLMEDTLRDYKFIKTKLMASLNPCFNGRYSQRRHINNLNKDYEESLNPCFNGRYSQSDRGFL